MITIFARDTEVIVQVQAEALGDERFVFRFNAGVGWAARLLAGSLSRSMYERLTAIREAAYADGWKDAKAKRARRDWFGGTWRVES